MHEQYSIEVSKGQSLIRIDKYLNDKIPHLSRCKIQDGIKDNLVLVNNKSIKVNYRVKPDDIISIHSHQEVRDKTDLAEKMDLDIIYEDEYLLIINKKAGIVIHPSFSQYSGTIYNGLLHYFENSDNINSKPHIVHRLDKNTSGLLVISKGSVSAAKLNKLFRNHLIERTYIAMVWGYLAEKKGTINEKIDRSHKDKKLIAVYKNRGKDSITHYEVIQELKDFSLVKCKLETGRTHQIRVHMSYLGHPLFYDYFYGGDTTEDKTINQNRKNEIEELFKIFPKYTLHSNTMSFIHPFTNQEMNFEVDLPIDFKNLIDLL